MGKDLKLKNHDIKGFSASNILRMKQFYETYKDNEKLATLLREIPGRIILLSWVGQKPMKQGNFFCFFAPKTIIPNVS